MAYKIGVDISGGDFAPQKILEGVILARREFPGDIVLIGKKEEIEREAFRFNASPDEFTIIDAPQKIDMEEPPAISVRRKRDSSIVKGVELLKNKEIDAFVSCGNTGAVVCASTLALGLIEGIERPGIALHLPTQKGLSLLIDVGANIDPKPLHLLHYGIMASAYYELVWDKSNPTVGLLNIGEEESKGPDFVRYVHRLFSASSLNFIGNLEAKDIFSGKCDCIVCDGFLGNIALKVIEGCAEAVGRFMIEAIKRSPLGNIALLLIKNSLKRFKKTIDYAEYGGAPLLGVDGIVIIGHGRSNGIAVKNAIKVAEEELKRDLNLNIRRRMDEVCQDSGLRQILTT